MSDDLRAQLKAVYDQIQNPLPLPSIADLCPITRVTAELRERVSAAIRANAAAIRLSGNSVVEEIHRRHEEIVGELLEHYQQGQLALFLDTNGTDAGLRRMPAGSINATKIETGSASIEDENGALVGSVSALAEFGREFLLDRGYDAPALEPPLLQIAEDDSEPPRERAAAVVAPEAERVELTGRIEVQPETVELPSGIRTNREKKAEEACGQWISAKSRSKWRPPNKLAAFNLATAAVKGVGPLSGKAFERAWAIHAPPEWKKAGRKKRGPD